jgi:hypothetical protein
MSASYERLLEEFYTSDRSKLEQILQSDAKEILNDSSMKKLLKEFILRIDKDSNFEPNSMKAIRYFELLSTIENLEDFNRERDEIKCFCSRRQGDLSAVVDESSLRRFVEVQKMKVYRKVDESSEYRGFKDYLKVKYQSRRRRR